MITKERAFDIAVDIFTANIRAGQYIAQRDLVEMTADALPNIYESVVKAWKDALDPNEILGFMEGMDGK